MIQSGLPEGGWRIRKFASDSGRDVIEEWLSGDVPIGDRKGVRVELETILRFLRYTRIELWSRPQFAWLKGGVAEGIGELILDYRGVPYRVLGCFGPTEECFCLLIGARKDRKRRGKVQWDPESAIATAARRMGQLTSRSLYEYIL